MNKLIILVLILLVAKPIWAQEKGHYFDITLGGGQNGLNYTIQNGDVKRGAGFTFNMGYSYFFNSNWGITSGLGLQSARDKATFNYSSSEMLVDQEGDPYEFRTKFEDWDEKQDALFIDIPLGIDYFHRVSEKTGILAYGGAKVSIPVSSTFTVTDGTITTTGYYADWNVEIYDVPQYGFMTNADRYTGDLSMKTSVSVFADLGVLIELTERNSLYIGGYINYGLNNLIDIGNDPVYGSAASYTNVLASSETDRATLFSFGLKAGVRIHILSFWDN